MVNSKEQRTNELATCEAYRWLFVTTPTIVTRFAFLYLTKGPGIALKIILSY